MRTTKSGDDKPIRYRRVPRVGRAAQIPRQTNSPTLVVGMKKRQSGCPLAGEPTCGSRAGNPL